jgi:hypothetical protein
MSSRRERERSERLWKSAVVIIAAMCFLMVVFLGCRTNDQEPTFPSGTSWNGPLTDGTNGIVQPPKW